MLFKFIGLYTNGHSSITAHGVTFDGNEPAEVTGKEAIRRLTGNPDFEAVHPLDHDGKGGKGGSLSGAKSTRARQPRRQKEASK